MVSNTIRRRVLVVDNEHVIADTLAIILQQHGFEAIATHSGEDALMDAARFQPDAVVTDVIMTGMNGIELAYRISARYPECRIILFSGQQATAELLEEARRQGHEFEILAKPVHPLDLLKILSDF